MKKFFLLGVLLAATMQLDAQQVSDGDRAALEKIKTGNEQYNAITSAFKHTRHVQMLGEDVVSSGKLYYCKPDRLAMQYDQPKGDLMLLNGDRFVMVTDGKRREVAAKNNARMKTMKTILTHCMMGDMLPVNAAKITCSETKNEYVVTASFTDKKSVFSKVIVRYDKKTFAVSLLRTEERDGNYNVYELTDKQFNASIDEQIFNTSKKK
jgi:outer membrane lipoprotein-sorting protein